ncbi:MAG: transcriptional regulator [Alphaproteobacteria bacterium]|nr:transcriptional regulator [Alphaproteobacteria bacterium]
MFSIEKAFLSLTTEKEIVNFLKDLITPVEYREIRARWKIAQMLNSTNKSYREISEELKVGLATVTRVARFLKDEPFKGYQLVLKRMKK